MNWLNKVCVITGGTTGIGKSTKDALREKGCKVYTIDNQIPEEEDAFYIEGDVSKYESITSAIENIHKQAGRIDFLFANAGVHLFASLEDTSIEQLHSIVGVNLFGVYYVLKSVIPIMKSQNKGSIVLMGSDQVFVGKANSSVYGLTKGAIGQLTKSTAIDYAPFNIRVNCICPGTINTPLLDNAVTHFSTISGIAENKIRESLDTVQPLGRIGSPEEIASSVMFLLSDDSSFTTGSLFAVDGGYVCQ